MGNILACQNIPKIKNPLIFFKGIEMRANFEGTINSFGKSIIQQSAGIIPGESILEFKETVRKLGISARLWKRDELNRKLPELIVQRFQSMF